MQPDPKYAWPIRTGTDSPWAYQLAYFTRAECELISSQANKLQSIQATLGAERTVDASVRQTTVSFFDPQDPETAWLFQRLESVIRRINLDFWQFDIRFMECIQYARYDPVGDFYCAHMDMRPDPDSQRKLGISVQLSADEDYQGGDLRLLRYGNLWDTAPRDQGSIVVFPGYQVHEVTPVTAGTRHSLVSWAVGPSFK